MRRPCLVLFGLILASSWGCGAGEDLAGASKPVADAGTDANGSGGEGGGSDAAPDDDAAPDAAAEATPDAPGVTVDDACAHLAAALCARLEACAPVLVDIGYGDQATCEGVLAPHCVQALALPDTVKTAAWTDACSTALEMETCEDLLTRNTPSTCLPPPGPRADGTPCGEDGQCASGYCGLVPNEVCGRCRPKASTGGACGRDDDCDLGLTCTGKNICAPYVPQGGPCNADQPCSPWLSCTTGMPPGQRTCEPVAGAGELCDAQGNGKPACDLVNGYFCNGLTHVCQALDLASAGDPCGVASGGYAICVAGSFCKLSGMSGTCLAPGLEGATCSVESGPWCQPGLGCAAGACHAYDPDSCN